MRKEASTSETTLVSMYETALRHIPEGRNSDRPRHCRRNFKTHTNPPTAAMKPKRFTTVSLVPMLNQANRIHTPIFYFRKIHFNIIFSATFKASK